MTSSSAQGSPNRGLSKGPRSIRRRKARDARRGSPVRAGTFEGVSPRLRRRHRDVVGLGHMEAGGDVDAALKRGTSSSRSTATSSRLVGARANGRMGFAGRRRRRRSWLLIKHRDGGRGTGHHRVRARASNEGDFEDIWRPTNRMWEIESSGKGGEAGECSRRSSKRQRPSKRAALHPKRRNRRPGRPSLSRPNRRNASPKRQLGRRRPRQESPRRANPSRERNERDAWLLAFSS